MIDACILALSTTNFEVNYVCMRPDGTGCHFRLSFPSYTQAKEALCYWIERNGL